MGYSCTQDADHMLGLIRHVLTNGKYSNGIVIGQASYFYDIGKEQDDGSITGQLWMNLTEDTARPVGSFKISAEGEIVRFPRLSAARRREIQALYADLRARNPMLLRSYAHGVI